MEPPSRIELRHLRCFLAAAEEQRTDRAAARLGIEQEVLVSAIGELESELGLTLFAPHRQGLTLTEAGRAFAGEVRAAVASLDRAVGELRGGNDRANRVRIGCPPELPLQHLMALLGAIYEREPGLRIEVAHLPRSESLRRLRFGGLELCLTEGAPGDELVTEPAFSGEPLAAFLPIGHRQAWDRGVALADLRGESLLMPPRDADPILHEALTSLGAGSPDGLPTVLEIGAGHPRDVIIAVAEGRGVTLGRASTIRAIGEAETIVSAHPIDPPYRLPDIVLAWSADPADRVAGLAETLRDVVRDLYSSGGHGPDDEG